MRDDERLEILGTDPAGLDLALLAARAGMAVTLVAGNADDAARLGHALRTCPGVRVVAAPDGPPAALSVLAPAPGDPALAPSGPAIALRPGADLPVLSLAAPAALLRLAEVAGDRDGRARRLADRLGRAVLDVPCGRDRPGLRLARCLARSTERLFLEGCVPHELDEALVAAGWRIGPCAAEDLAGLDAGHAERRARGEGLPVRDRMVAEGRLGRQTGVGWYRYPGGGGAVADPLIEDLIAEEARFAGIAPSARSPDAAADILRAALAEEARALLDDAMLDRAGLAAVLEHGLGAPPGLARD